MKFNEKRIKEILLEGNYITEEDSKKADAAAASGRGTFLNYLSSEGLITKDLLGQAIAESFGIAYADLNSNVPPKEQVLKIPAETAKDFRLILFSEDEKSVVVATDHPNNAGLTEALGALFPDVNVSVAFSHPDDIDEILRTYYRQPLDTRFLSIIESGENIAPEIVQEILSDALSYKASDIHLEPQKENVVVRFRVDGVLQEVGRIPKEYYETILNRIKVESRLRIDEHAAAQDGSMRYENNGMPIDMRTSVIPTVEGEKVVLRILAAYIEGLTLEHLGLTEDHRRILETAIQKPFGMILVTGPTGSGKTTTLYALLRLLNNPEVNITTIEDPVEYKVRGVNQIQVNKGTQLTFAKGLRSIVRQDPDIILVGEIRDRETAEIAVNAALTGHLLLSTFHANNASTVIPRLLDMESEPFLIASTLEVIVAQRLVRTICETCRYSVSLTPKDFGAQASAVEQFFGKKIAAYRGKGCSSCGDTGYQGRTAIFECIGMTPEMQALILTSPSEQEIWSLARSLGTASLFEDGVLKVKNGITTIEELLRVAEPPVDNKS